MASDQEDNLQSKLAIYVEVLRKTALELNAHRWLIFLLAKQYPRLDFVKLLSSCRDNQALRKETEGQLSLLRELLDDYDSTPLAEALEAFEKWTPPETPPN